MNAAPLGTAARGIRRGLAANSFEHRVTGITSLKTLAWILVIAAALGSPAQALAGERVPFEGSDSGTFAFDPFACSAGLQVLVTGAGTATHIGKYTYRSTECFDPATGEVTAGSFRLTAANGDTIAGTFSGRALPSASPNVVILEHTALVTGGTGRFAGATGQLVFAGEADLASARYHQTLGGTIASPGSTKRLQ